MNARPAHGPAVPRAVRIGSNLVILMVLSLLAAQAAASPRGSLAGTIPAITVRAKALAPQPTAVHYDPDTREVTIEASLSDTPKNTSMEIRRDSFIVYENGVRQNNVDVSIEHRPVSVGLLIEFGGRYHALNEMLGQDVQAAANQLLDEIAPQDELSIWKYGDGVEPLAVPSTPALIHLGTPPFSETNFYDALQATLPQSQLAQLARESGGRLYVPDSSLDFAAVYDRLMADLRLGYVIRYTSTADALAPRTVRVDLIGSKGTRQLIAASQVPEPTLQSAPGAARSGA